MSEQPARFDCEECGEGITVDEDGCCVSCGKDATVVAVSGGRWRLVPHEKVGAEDKWLWADRFNEEFPFVVEAMNQLEATVHRGGKFDGQLCLRINTISKRVCGMLTSLMSYRRGYIPGPPFGEPTPFVPKNPPAAEEAPTDSVPIGRDLVEGAEPVAIRQWRKVSKQGYPKSGWFDVDTDEKLGVFRSRGYETRTVYTHPAETERLRDALEKIASEDYYDMDALDALEYVQGIARAALTQQETDDGN